MDRFEDTLHFVFGIFGNATALFLYLSPIVTFKRIIKKRSTEEFSGLPYVTTLLNCLLSAWYGLPFVSPNNILVVTIDETGSIIELAFVTIFLIYSPKNEKKKMGALLTLVVAIFVAYALLSVFAFHGRIRQHFCGFALATFTVIMYVSPLSIIRLVIKTKSVEFMPLLLTFSTFLCGTSWLIFGLLEKDPFISIPSGIGCGIGAIQLIVYAIYCDKTQFMINKKNCTRRMVQSNEMPQQEKKQSAGTQILSKDDEIV